MRYLSDAYRELFAELRDEFDYVVTLSDHGEMLGEYGMVDHAYGVYPQESNVRSSFRDRTSTIRRWTRR